MYRIYKQTFMPRSFSLFASASVLLVAVLALFFGKAAQRRNLTPVDLAELFPREVAGWTVVDKPIAESPEMLKTVEKILSYDSAVFRVYKQGSREISVYAAYWLPAKIPASHVDAHTPDICWVANGWKMDIRAPLSPQPSGQELVPVPNHRHFTISGTEISVVYWHVNGEKLRRNESVWEPTLSFGQRISRRVAQFKNLILNPPGQQLFVRVSSTGEISNEMDAPPVQATLTIVAKALRGEEFFTHK